MTNALLPQLREDGRSASERGETRVGRAMQSGGLRGCSVSFASPGSADGELALATLGHAEDVLAVGAEHDVLGVGEHTGHSLADGALDVHEVGVGALNLSLQLVHELLLGGVNVNEIDFHFDFDALALVDDYLLFKQ